MVLDAVGYALWCWMRTVVLDTHCGAMYAMPHMSHVRYNVTVYVCYLRTPYIIKPMTPIQSHVR
jgi:hypothetical protein